MPGLILRHRQYGWKSFIGKRWRRMDLSYQRIRQKNRDTTLLLIPLVAILAKFIHLYKIAIVDDLHR